MAITTALLITAAIAGGIATAASFVVQALIKPPKAETGSLDAGQLVQRRISDGEALEVLIGERITGGIAAHDNSYGDNSEFFTWATVLSARPCTSHVSFYLDSVLTTLSGDPSLGEVEITNAEFRGKNGEARAWLRIFLGDDNSQLGAYMKSKFPTDFDLADVGGEMCVAIFTAQHTNDDLGDEDDPKEKQGQSFIPWQGPPSMKWRMQGTPICDPRVAGSIYSDPSTYVYATEAALVDAQIDYGFWDGAPGSEALIVGNGYPEGLLDLDFIKASASHCAAKGYHVNGVIRSNNSADQEEVHKCMNATRIEAPGFVKTLPESFRALWGTIDKEDCGDGWASLYDEHGSSTEVINQISGSYVEPLEDFTNKTLPLFSKAEWIAADNHIPRSTRIPFNMVTDGSQALLLLKQEAFVSRATATVELKKLPIRFLEVPVGDLVDLTGWDIPAINGRRWVVESVARSEDELITIGLKAWAGDSAMTLDASADPTPPVVVSPPTRIVYDPAGNEIIPNSLLAAIAQQSTDLTLLDAGSELFSDDPLDGFLISSDGSLSANAAFRTSRKIYAEAGRVILYRGNATGAVAVAAYNSSSALISTVLGGVNQTEDAELTLPSGTKFIRACAQISSDKSIRGKFVALATSAALEDANDTIAAQALVLDDYEVRLNALENPP